MSVHRQAPSSWRQEPPGNWWERIAVVKASQNVNEPRESAPAHAEQAAVLEVHDGDQLELPLGEVRRLAPASHPFADQSHAAFGISALLMQPIGIKNRPRVSALAMHHRTTGAI